MSRTIVLDNKAVQALLLVGHPKHAQALAHVQVVATRKRRAAMLRVVVPTAVRVQAGWDRTASSAAFINRLRVADAVLDVHAANVAAGLRAAHGLSVADAHLGAVIDHVAGEGDVSVITSDPHDVRLAAGHHRVTIAVV